MLSSRLAVLGEKSSTAEQKNISTLLSMIDQYAICSQDIFMEW